MGAAIKRNTSIDIIKGIAIFCVVAGHSLFPLTHFISLFHVAVFFIASGYFFKASNSEGGKNLFLFLKRKFITLWLVYVIWMAIFTLLHNFFITIHVYTDDPRLLEYIPQTLGTLKERLTLTEMGENIAKAMIFHAGTEMGAAFWFIETMMELAVAYCVIDFALKKIFKKEAETILLYQTIVSVVFLILGFICAKTNHTLHGLSKMLSVYILYHGGYVMKRFRIYEKERSESVHFAVLAVSLAVLIVCDRIGFISLNENKYVNPFFFLIVSFAGWSFLYETAFFVQKFSGLTKVLVCMGRNTLAVVVLHLLCFKIVNVFGVLISGKPACLIAAFPVLYEGGAWWIAYTAVGLGVPIALNQLRKKCLMSLIKNKKRGSA